MVCTVFRTKELVEEEGDKPLADNTTGVVDFPALASEYRVLWLRQHDHIEN